jgi:hypothetical protein
MQKESFEHVHELLEKDKIEVAATRIWTSAQTLDCIPHRIGMEFSSLLNEVLRGDDAVSEGSAMLQRILLNHTVLAGHAEACVYYHSRHKPGAAAASETVACKLTRGILAALRWPPQGERTDFPAGRHHSPRWRAAAAAPAVLQGGQEVPRALLCGHIL